MVRRDTGSVQVEAALLDASDGTGQNITVRSGTNGATIHVFFVDGAADLGYKKSTDSGATWGSFQTIEGTDAYIGCSVWYDRWTIGDTTGNIIHIFATDSTNTELTYFSLDASDDSAGTNDNTVIDTAATTITPSSGGRVCGCKAKNGDLMTGYTATAHATQVGWNFYKSDDTGATWTLKNGDGNPAQHVNSVNDSCLLMPLSTDDDILFFGIDTTLKQTYTCVFDNSATDSWESAAVRVGAQAWLDTDEAFGSQQLSAAYDHSNADCFLMLTNADNSTRVNSTYSFYYDESTRTISIDDVGLAGGFMDLINTSGLDECIGWLSGRQITRNEDTGQLIIFGMSGNFGTIATPCYCVSNDNGRTWTQRIMFQSFVSTANTVPDDFRKMDTPPFTDTASGLTFLWFDDDDQDIFHTIEPLTLFAAVTGNCKDDAGTNDQDVTVRMYQKSQTGNYNWTDTNEKFVGQDITDASGNWSIAPLPTEIKSYLGGERNYYCTYYDNKGDIKTPVTVNWKMDTDNWGTVVGTQITRDTGNSEIDFTMGSSTADNHIYYETPAGLVGTDFLKWSIDFDLRIDTLTQGASSNKSMLYVGFTVNSSGMDSSSLDAIGLRLHVSSAVNKYSLLYMEATSALAANGRSDFAHTPIAETLYVRMGIKAKDTFSIALYSDAARTTLVEEETYDTTNIPLTDSYASHNTYFYIATDDLSADDSTIDGAVKNIRLYSETTGNVVAVDTGSDTDLTDQSLVDGQV